jgi:glycerate-2-kinase
MAQRFQTGSSLLEYAERIFKAALEEVKPESLVRKSVSLEGEKIVIQGQSFSLARFDRIFLVSVGKAAPFMAKSLSDILGKRLEGGIAVCLPQTKKKLQRITCLPASHPLPDQKSLRAAQRILGLARGLGEKDLLFFLVSGGGSAQVCLPSSGVSLDEKRRLTEMLLSAGASIAELNTVRKHLSQIKGGRLARAAFPATVISLVISDVVGNDLENIASGPAHWDSSTYEDAYHVLKKYGLWSGAPLSVRAVIENGMEKRIEETVKREDLAFSHVHNFIIGDNLLALQAAERKAGELGFQTSILTSSDRGEAKEAAKNYVSLFLNSIQSIKASSKPVCLLAGGEITVTVRGKGRGGRNQEFVLAALDEMENHPEVIPDWLILSLGSDGIDGPTDAAGAWAGPSILKKAKELSLNLRKYLADNDSYNFFKRVGGLIITGPTQTNVMDIRLFMIGGCRSKV